MTTTGESRPADAPDFTVVVGTYNGGRTLAAALDALAAQVTTYGYEVLVVDDASTDDTAAIASRAGVHLITLEENRGHGHTLNVGLAAARGRYLALMDDDCVPPPDWIQRLGDAWAGVSPSVTMIGGLVEPHATDSFNRRYVEYRRPLRHQEQSVSEGAGLWSRLLHQLAPPRLDPSPRSVFFTVGANMSVRTDAARDVGGFTARRGAGEEESIARPLRARFGEDTVRLFPEIVMHHNFDRSLRDTLRRSRSYGRTSGATWVREGGLPSTAPLPACGALLAGLSLFVDPLLALAVVVLAPPLLYRRFAGWMRSRGSVEAAAFPYVQAVEDLVNNVGFLQGAWREARSRRHRVP